MTNSQVELLTYIAGFEDGATAVDISGEFDVTESTANQRLSRLRKKDFVKRVRNDEGQYAHILTPKGKEVLETVKNNPWKREVREVANVDDTEEVTEVTYELSSDLVDAIEEIAEDEDRDINDVVEELLCTGLDALYEEEGGEAQELETR